MGLWCLPLSFCEKQGHKWPLCAVCRQCCFKFCRNYSRDLNQPLFWAVSASRAVHPVGSGPGVQCSVHLWEPAIQGQVSGRSVLRLTVTPTWGWINFQRAEEARWIPKGVLFVHKKGHEKNPCCKQSENVRREPLWKKSDIVLSINYALPCIDHRNGPLPWKQQYLIPRAAYSQLSSHLSESTDRLSEAFPRLLISCLPLLRSISPALCPASCAQISHRGMFLLEKLL